MRKKKVIPDIPVRIKILNGLIGKSYPLHFSEIRELIHKQDAVTGRELKTLVEAGLVIKNSEGLYSVNKDPKDHAEIFTQLALNDASTRFHYLMDSLNIFVFIACEEMDAGLIGINDIWDNFENNTVDRFTDSVQELILTKVMAVLKKEIERGLLHKRIPIDEALAHYEATRIKPCKIMITCNIPFFEEPIFEEGK